MLESVSCVVAKNGGLHMLTSSKYPSRSHDSCASEKRNKNKGNTLFKKKICSKCDFIQNIEQITTTHFGQNSKLERQEFSPRLLLLIIYHDFLPPPRSGSHVKPDNTHTHTQSHQDDLAHIYSP